MQKIFTVIHGQSKDQIYRNIEKSANAGADGSFLINHAGISVDELIESYIEFKNYRENFVLGINILGVSPKEAMDVAISVSADAFWSDESFVRSYEDYQFESELDWMDEKRKSYKGLYFGGVAFKTQEECTDYEKAAKNAIGHMDVITTSGTGTGIAPEEEKIKIMKNAIGSNKLGIASGVNYDNIDKFKLADYLLVATGVQDSWTELNYEKIFKLISKKS